MSERVVERRVSRQTGHPVVLVDRGLDDEERIDAEARGYEWARWETICLTHGGVCSHLTRAVARSWLAEPGEWCEDCGDELEATQHDDDEERER